MLHDEYNKYFRDIASNHKAIQHNPDATKHNFFRIIVSGEPFPTYYIEEFVKAQKAKINSANQVMLLESFEDDIDNDKTGYTPQKIQGSFIILQKPANDKFDSEEEAISLAESTVHDIISHMIKTMETGCNVSLDRRMSKEKVGPIGTAKFFGTKLYFSFTMDDPNIVYDESKWLNPLTV